MGLSISGWISKSASTDFIEFVIHCNRYECDSLTKFLIYNTDFKELEIIKLYIQYMYKSKIHPENEVSDSACFSYLIKW